MKKYIPNFNEPHSSIVFSTSVPNSVLKEYSRWEMSGGNGSNESKNAAWVRFCNECEAHGLLPLIAINLIIK